MGGSGGGEHVVVAGVLRRGGRVLVVHRSPLRTWYPGVWDLPGGHVETGEDPCAALGRELAEELGITATVSGPPFAHLDEDDYAMDVWFLDRWSGQVANRAPHEHDALAWVDPAQAATLQPALAYVAGLVATAFSQRPPPEPC